MTFLPGPSNLVLYIWIPTQEKCFHGFIPNLNLSPESLHPFPQLPNHLTIPSSVVFSLFLPATPTWQGIGWLSPVMSWGRNPLTTCSYTHLNRPTGLSLRSVAKLRGRGRVAQNKLGNFQGSCNNITVLWIPHKYSCPLLSKICIRPHG